MKKLKEIYREVVSLQRQKGRGVSAQEISNALNINRANASRYLNRLSDKGWIKKIQGRPVLFCSEDLQEFPKKDEDIFSFIVGSDFSLKVPVQQAKAAVLYPPSGLHTLILGETGTGKSMFAELMYKFAVTSDVLEKSAPFIRFNCSDYADNPQLLVAQIFGVKKGAFTGADKSRQGLLKKADGGVLFIDEIHRLPPQGQEMLFLYFDKGYFRPLGDTEGEEKVEVRIFAATTENPYSSLLKTFMRRIPMVITLPPLGERGLEERYNLIELFIKEESQRIGKDIFIDKNAFISFLLYDCPNNIGQLKNDIQLACAKAFLKYKSQNKDFILITGKDIPQHVKAGLMMISEYRETLEQLLQQVGEVLKFQETYPSVLPATPPEEKYFYDIIEQKLVELKKENKSEEEINQILQMDIEMNFQEYLGTVERYGKEEIGKIVSHSVVDMVEKILRIARQRLGREYDNKVFCGLSLHLQRSIERIRNGERIFHPRLNQIRVDNSQEFLVALEVAKLIDEEFAVEIPLDEIGYLTMFLASKPFETKKEQQNKVGILVILHGDSTASSMVRVANALVGVDHAAALDMPLHMKPQAMYSTAREKVQELEQGKGVLMLVDMGSLLVFGDMMAEDINCEVKTIDLVSTPMVIEATRKAVLGENLEEIYKACKNIANLAGKDKETGVQLVEQISKKNIIVTACFTGQGASLELKKILEENLISDYELEIIALEILDREDFLAELQKLQKKHRIIAVVGTVDIPTADLPKVSALDVMEGKGIAALKKQLENEEMYNNMVKSLREHLTEIDSERAVANSRNFIQLMEEKLNLVISGDVKVGITLHICFLLDRLRKGKMIAPFAGIEEFRQNYLTEMEEIAAGLKDIEAEYQVKIGEDERAHLCRLFLQE